MRLASVRYRGHDTLAIAVDGTSDQVAVVPADSGLPTSMTALAALGAGGLARLAAQLPDLPKAETADLQMLAPVPAPGKIVAIGLNYADHAAEGGHAIPESPTVFAKFPTAVLPHGGAITWDRAVTTEVDYEAELAVVIGTATRHVSEERALDHVFGYTCMNDVSARDLQRKDGQWVRAKSLDTFCPAGPWLVTADERGVETHGLMRLRSYVERIEAGGTAADPTIVICRESATTALMDGGNALGAVADTAAMELAIGKAADSGVGLVVVRNINHYGAAAYYSMMAAEKGMIGLSMTNVLALMAPTGGAQPLIGNNPLSLAFPGTSDPIVWDSAMSKSTWGRALLAAQRDEPLPSDAFLDQEGRPTTDPKAVFAGGSLLPIAGYKGYGLALCVALLTGVLGGWRFDAQISGRQPHEPGDNSALMGAIRVSDFLDGDTFARQVVEIARTLRTAPKQPGVDRIWLPGEKEAELARDRRMNGVPVQAAARDDIAALADRLGVTIDDRLRRSLQQ
ncbi:hypothetical protein GCM10023075_47510 [Streptosporangium album]